MINSIEYDIRRKIRYENLLQSAFDSRYSERSLAGTDLTRRNPRDFKDYRSISDPSVVYHNGKWILYQSFSVAYITEDFVNWKHIDIFGINTYIQIKEMNLYFAQ